MTKLKIANLNLNVCPISLKHQMQKQVQGGINMELFNLLEQNKKDLMASYGNIGDNAFMLNLVVDYGLNNQISQSPS